VANRRSTATAAAINETAANWLLRVEASTSAELREGLQKWLDAEPRHRAAFIRLRCAWHRTDKLRLLRPSDGRVDEDLLSKLTYEED
jgi:ferric-dicitrate binding protein FerR (iron transport regulator)